MEKKVRPIQQNQEKPKFSSKLLIWGIQGHNEEEILRLSRKFIGRFVVENCWMYFGIEKKDLVSGSKEPNIYNKKTEIIYFLLEVMKVESGQIVKHLRILGDTIVSNAKSRVLRDRKDYMNSEDMKRLSEKIESDWSKLVRETNKMIKECKFLESEVFV